MTARDGLPFAACRAGDAYGRRFEPFDKVDEEYDAPAELAAVARKVPVVAAELKRRAGGWLAVPVHDVELWHFRMAIASSRALAVTCVLCLLPEARARVITALQRMMTDRRLLPPASLTLTPAVLVSQCTAAPTPCPHHACSESGA